MLVRNDVLSLPGLVASSSDRFVVERMIAGGMGVCARVSHTETGEVFALKGLRPQLTSDARSWSRFEREALVWIALSNIPGIAPALAVVRWNEMPFIAARWMEGGDLSARGAITSPEVYFKVALRVAAALDVADRSHGAIHRDIKPSNILFDDRDEPFLTDWGIAKVSRRGDEGVAVPAGNDVLATAVGSFIGTVVYSAPEQIVDAASVDWRADLYALGCVLYELETGRPPFLGATPQAIAEQHIRRQPQGIPGSGRFGTASIIHRCLAKAPGERYQSYTELIDALERVAMSNCIAVPPRLAPRSPRRRILSRDGRFAIVELKEAEAALAQAEVLMGFQRYREAHDILRRYYFPEFLDGAPEWHMMHVIALNLAMCLSSIKREQRDATEIFQRLEPVPAKPAEFYLNYSNTCLRACDWSEAERVARAGRQYFPDDGALLGNLMMSLVFQAKTSEALEVAAVRVAATRDVSALLETAIILQTVAATIEENWPAATLTLQKGVGLLDEAMALNPRVARVHFVRAQMLRSLFRFEEASNAVQMAWHSPDGTPWRQWLVALQAQLLWDVRSPGELFRFSDEWLPLLTDRDAKRIVARTRSYALLETAMIGKMAAGERVLVPEVVSFYEAQIGDQATTTADDHIECARIYEWLGRTEEAIAMLDVCLEQWPRHWRAAMNKAYFLFRAGHRAEAESVGWEAVACAPYRPEPLDALSCMYDWAGDSVRATEARARAEEVFARRQQLAHGVAPPEGN